MNSCGAVARVQPMALLQEQGHLAPRTQVVLYTDNTASVAVVSLPGGTWRTRHLRIKGAWLQEQVSKGWIVTHLPGACLCADMLTKALPRERFHMLLRLCELASLPSNRAAELRNTESLRRALVVLVVATCAQGAAGQPTAGDEPGALGRVVLGYSVYSSGFVVGRSEVDTSVFGS